MKVKMTNGVEVTFEQQDNAELRENPESVLKAVFEQFSWYNTSLTIQQNDNMRQMMIPSCPVGDMVQIVRKYVSDYNAEIDFIGEHHLAKNIVVAVRTETEQKSGVYDYNKDDFSLTYSEINDNPAVKRLLGCLK